MAFGNIILFSGLLTAFCTSVLASPLSDSGGIIRWGLSSTNTNLNYYIDPSASGIATVVQQAFTDWAAIPSVYVSFTQVVSSATANIVVMVPSSLGISGAAGVANVQTDGTGTIQSCTTNISASTASSSNPKGVIQHEIGHCLGLAHSVVNGAVMSYWANQSSYPTEDDSYALTLLYPRGSNPGYPLGCATVNQKGGTGRQGKLPLMKGLEKWAALELFLLFGMMSLGIVFNKRTQEV